MKINSFRVTLLSILVVAVLCTCQPLLRGQQAQQVPPAPADETMTSEEFTQLLKQVWSFLKLESEKFQEDIAAKSEFETTTEYDRRVVERRGQYVANIIKFSRDQKLNQRAIRIYYKAILENYNADTQVYVLKSPFSLDAPYNIPSVSCNVPKNPYLALADSVRKGYRTSSLYLNFAPEFRWSVSREVAQNAKQNEENVFFRARVKIDIESNDGKSEAKLNIVPLEVSLVNRTTNQVFWTQKVL